MTFQLNIIRQLRREMAEEGERLSLWLPVFLAIGIGLYFSLGHEPPAALMVAAGLLVVALIFLGQLLCLCLCRGHHRPWDGCIVVVDDAGGGGHS